MLMASLAKESSSSFSGLVSTCHEPASLTPITRLVGLSTIPTVDSVSTKSIANIALVRELLPALPGPTMFTWALFNGTVSMNDTCSANFEIFPVSVTVSSFAAGIAAAFASLFSSVAVVALVTGVVAVVAVVVELVGTGAVAKNLT